MKTPNFSLSQYLDAGAFNIAMSGISTSAYEAAGMSAIAGLLGTEAASFVVSGLVLNTSIPKPFGAMFPDGSVAYAHGAVDNVDTSNYSTNFSLLVPASGSVTAYLLASEVVVQQTPVQVVGPPAGHPDYDPTFTPYTAYQVKQLSLGLTASTTPADNSTTFEICRMTLTPGLVTLPTPNTTRQNKATNVTSMQQRDLAAPVSMTAGSSGICWNITTSGAVTLPALTTSGSKDVMFNFMISTTGVTFQTVGGNTILGTGVTPGTGVTSFSATNGTAVTIVGGASNWRVVVGGFSAASLGTAAFQNVAFFLQSANNLSDVASVSTSRTNLGLGTAAQQNSTFFLQVGNNLSDLNNATTARSNLGLGSAAVRADTFWLQVANNLSDLTNAVTARGNLGLGSAATFASTAFMQGANNLSEITSATTARSNLGLGSAATFASTAFMQGANNLSEITNAATARSNLGLGSAATFASTAFMQGANNLSDVSSPSISLSNLGVSTFLSSLFFLSSYQSYSQAHGISNILSRCSIGNFVMINVTPEHGYTTGDNLIFTNATTGSGTGRGVSLSFDSTTAYWSRDVNGIYIQDKTGGLSTITLSNWEGQIRLVAIG